jgi:hypothetical protein
LGELRSHQRRVASEILASAFPKSERAPRESAIAEQVRDADASLPLDASVRRRWRESSKPSSGPTGAGVPFRGQAIARSIAAEGSKRSPMASAVTTTERQRIVAIALVRAVRTRTRMRSCGW